MTIHANTHRGWRDRVTSHLCKPQMSDRTHANEIVSLLEPPSPAEDETRDEFAFPSEASSSFSKADATTKKARRMTVYPNVNSTNKVEKPFSRSAAKRGSVMALGSIEHLQHYFTKAGLSASKAYVTTLTLQLDRVNANGHEAQRVQKAHLFRRWALVYRVLPFPRMFPHSYSICPHLQCHPPLQECPRLPPHLRLILRTLKF